jgi:recombinational DNA repair ATPase RecF
MHIKKITIFNFRSFQQQPEIAPFSPGTNSVVGRNGSGKSNLFDAVQFVLLAPRFYSLRQVTLVYSMTMFASLVPRTVLVQIQVVIHSSFIFFFHTLDY